MKDNMYICAWKLLGEKPLNCLGYFDYCGYLGNPHVGNPQVAMQPHWVILCDVVVIHPAGCKTSTRCKVYWSKATMLLTPFRNVRGQILVTAPKFYMHTIPNLTSKYSLLFHAWLCTVFNLLLYFKQYVLCYPQ